MQFTEDCQRLIFEEVHDLAMRHNKLGNGIAISADFNESLLVSKRICTAYYRESQYRVDSVVLLTSSKP